jgi:hypothetical protein
MRVLSNPPSVSGWLWEKTVEVFMSLPFNRGEVENAVEDWAETTDGL